MIKNSLKNIIDKFKDNYKRFPITLSLIIILTILYTINIDIKFMKYVYEILLLSVGPIFLIETTNNKKLYYYIGIFFVSILLTVMLQFYGIFNRIVALYSLLTWIYAIYFNYKKSKESFEKYLSNVLINIFKSCIIYLILVVGVAIIGLLFESLIFSYELDLVLKLEILVLGFYFVPGLIYSLCSTEKDLYNFSKIVFKYVLAPLLILSFLIIYIYMAKILILWQIPSNQIFRILSILFIIGCPIWTSIIGIGENNLIDKINKKLPILFIPFILLQIYSISVRIYNNGITMVRYLGIALVLFEIIYVVIYIKNNKKIDNLFHILSIILIISLILPFINMFNISKLSQYNNLKIYKEKSNYTESDKSKIKGAYYYLRSLEEDKLIEDLLTDEDIDKISKFAVGNTVYESEFISASIEEEKVDIEGYKELEEVSMSFNAGDDNFLEDKIRDYLKHKDNINEYFKENNVVIYDDKKLIITYMDVNYEFNSLNIEFCYIQGYMLYK